MIPRAATEDCSSQGFCRNDKGKGAGKEGKEDRRKQREEGGLRLAPSLRQAPRTPAPASHFPKVAPGCVLLQLASCQRFH